MKTGDRVRTKNDFLGLKKGTVGEITYIDDFTGEIKVKFDNGGVAIYTLAEIEDFLELIRMETKVSCPAVLKAWYYSVTKYIGDRNE